MKCLPNFLPLVLLALSSLLFSGQAFALDHGLNGRDAAFWEEFQRLYSSRSLSDKTPAQLQKEAEAIVLTTPQFQPFKSQLANLSLGQQVSLLADKRKKPSFEIVESIVSALVKSHSEFNSYLTLAERQKVIHAKKSRGAGTGMQLNLDRKGQYFLIPFTNSPAEKGGVRKGDQLIEVDGRPVISLSLSAVKNLILGPEGSQVRIRVRRSTGRESDLKIERGFHREPLTRLTEKMGSWSLQIRAFNDGVLPSFTENIKKIPTDSRLIIDLRGNVGGNFSDARKILSLLSPQDAVLYQIRESGKTTLVRDKDNTHYKFRSISILLDGFSASASEIFAASLFAQGGVSLMGDRTYGKDTLLSEYLVANAGILTFETAEFFDPQGRSWARGINPAKWPEQ